jgi:hypothetical protein
MAVESRNSPATEIIFERVIEMIENDDFEYPNDVSFIPADDSDFGRSLRRELLKEKPIVVVYPDGTERFIPAVTARRPRS